MRCTKFFVCMLMLMSMQSLFAENFSQVSCFNPMGSYCVEPCRFFDGFYVGVAAGEATNFSKQSILNTSVIDFEFGGPVPGSTVLDNTISFSNHNYKIRGIGEIFAGYGWAWHSCNFWGGYLGIRAGGNFSSFNLTKNYPQTLSLIDIAAGTPQFIGSITNKLSTHTRLNSSEFTLDAKPGILLGKRTMVFGLLGVALNRSKTHLSESFVISGLTLAGPLSLSVSLSDTKRGHWAHFRWGLGLEHMLTNRIGINAHYTHTDYGKIHLATTATAQATTPTTTARLLHNSKVTIRNIRETIKLGLAYYF